MKKKAMLLSFFALIIVIGAFSLETLLSNIAVPKTQTFSDVLGGEEPSSILLRTPEKKISVSNPKVVQSFHELNKDKSATRIFVSETADFQENMMAILNYNNEKGQDMVIDDKGKIFIVVGKGSIRNQSILHWFWWKLNGLHDHYTYLYYYTDPDPKVVEMVNDMKRNIP